jgi:hypothetical protein
MDMPSSCVLSLTKDCRPVPHEALPVRSKLRPDYSGRLRGSYPETGFEEITGDVLERDFWTAVRTEGYRPSEIAATTVLAQRFRATSNPTNTQRQLYLFIAMWETHCT